MENKNVVILKRHPRAIKFTNSFYTNQCPDLEVVDGKVIDHMGLAA